MLENGVKNAIHDLYQTEYNAVTLELTNRDYSGDYTFVVFPILRISKKNPETTAQEIGEYLQKYTEMVVSFNVVKGFLNIEIGDIYWINLLKNNWQNLSYGSNTLGSGKTVMVEYSSPNTNKPLHLGHVRNNLLGYSVARLHLFNGYGVIKANLINDRGIHICKSMLAWQKFGNGETPESSGIKGDHLVGKYYVEFDKRLKVEVEALSKGEGGDDASKIAPLMLEAQEMLRKWEAGDASVLQLWQTMNQWVYDGFKISYNRLGVDFDKLYYESDTYKLGKNIVDEGLQKGIFYRKEDNSVWIDLTAEGLDHKLVLRSDGTSVYITQDIGTADKKYHEFQPDLSIYVVGNEQDYHFKVLFLIMKKLGRPYAEGMHHLSYGMVDLPGGKMKSREGTVVDADDLMQEMHDTAKLKTIELGKIEGMSQDEQNTLFETLGMAALKFHILKVDPKKRMLFNPEESIDFQGDTGTFVMYTFTRIQSMLKMAGNDWALGEIPEELHDLEKQVLKTLHEFPYEVQNACRSYSPSIICQYSLNLAKSFNRLYNELPVLRESNLQIKALRLRLAFMTANTIKNCLNLLGINAVDRM